MTDKTPSEIFKKLFNSDSPQAGFQILQDLFQENCKTIALKFQKSDDELLGQLNLTIQSRDDHAAPWTMEIQVHADQESATQLMVTFFQADEPIQTLLLEDGKKEITLTNFTYPRDMFLEARKRQGAPSGPNERLVL